MRQTEASHPQQASPDGTRPRIWAAEVPVRADLRALSRFPHTDYADTFEIAVAPGRRTAEQWARAVFEGAPAGMRMLLTGGWRLLGVQLAPPRVAGYVQGWRIVKNSPDAVVLQARSIAGLTARLVLQADAPVLRFATFVRCDGLIGRAIWFGVAPLHRLIVSRLLGDAAQ
ncbi:MAG TPA: DUF2867 domain-containing protein [Streptosporangiaceae bacterium]